MITQQELKDKVRQLLNESADDSAVTLLSDDTRNIDEHILSLLPDAVLFVQMNSDAAGVNPKRATIQPENILVADNGCGTFELPSDFVRLINFRMQGWHRACKMLCPPDSAQALAQSNPYTRAGWCRPVCVEGVSSDGKRTLSYYSLPEGTAPEVASFVYEAAYNADEGLAGTNEYLIKAVAYQCAALLCNIFEKPDSANAFLSIAAALCSDNRTDKKQ